MTSIQIISLFPDFFATPLRLGVVGTAIETGLVKVDLTNPRDFATDKHKTVDDRPFGGGDGMVMKTEPLAAALSSLGQKKGHVVMLSPAGVPFSVEKSLEYARMQEPLTLICGRYSGVDQRFVEKYCDEELSIGDYVLSGGEPAALVVIDSVVRLLPNVLGNQDSPEQDSFFEGLLECPSYTRPREIEGLTVPEELLSGDHAGIDQFRKKVSLLRTALRRPDLLTEALKRDLHSAYNWAQGLSQSELETLGLKEIGKIFETKS